MVGYNKNALDQYVADPGQRKPMGLLENPDLMPCSRPGLSEFASLIASESDLPRMMALKIPHSTPVSNEESAVALPAHLGEF